LLYAGVGVGVLLSAEILAAGQFFGFHSHDLWLLLAVSATALAALAVAGLPGQCFDRRRHIYGNGDNCYARCKSHRSHSAIQRSGRDDRRVWCRTNRRPRGGQLSVRLEPLVFCAPNRRGDSALGCGNVVHQGSLA